MCAPKKDLITIMKIMMIVTAASMVCQKKSQEVSVTSPGNVNAATRTMAIIIIKTNKQSIATRAIL